MFLLLALLFANASASTEWATPETVASCISPSKEQCLALSKVAGVSVGLYSPDPRDWTDCKGCRGYAGTSHILYCEGPNTENAVPCCQGCTGCETYFPSVCLTGPFNDCTRPDTTGYTVQENSLNFSAFNVTAACAAGYVGVAQATNCPANGSYSLSGCSPVTVCGENEYEFSPLTATDNRVCKTITNCGNRAEVSPPTATSDRVCGECADPANTVKRPILNNQTFLCDEVCTKDDYLVVAPNATTEQDCEPLTVCQSNEVETKPPVFDCVDELPPTKVYFGCTDPNAMNYNPNAVFSQDYFVGEPEEDEGGYGEKMTHIKLLHTDCLYESCAKAPFNGCLENNTLWINASCSDVEYYKNNPGPAPPIPIGTLQNCTSLHNGSMTEITLKVGCKDPKASNYDPSANVWGDFHCLYDTCDDVPVEGCNEENTWFNIDLTNCDNVCSVPVPALCNESDAPALSDRVCLKTGTEAPTEAPTTTEAPEDSGVNGWAIAGGVAGLGALIGLGIYMDARSKRGRKRVDYSLVDSNVV